MSERIDNPVTEDGYLAQLKSLGKDDDFIAAKLGLPIQEVRKRWRALVEAKTDHNAGTYEILEVFRALRQQHLVMGQVIDLLANATGNVYEVSELRKLIDSCPKKKDLAAWLTKHATVLKPFQIPPEMIEGAPPEN
jgi:hypothetical protein